VVRIGLTQPRVRPVRIVAPELFVIDGLDLLTGLSTPLACTLRAVCWCWTPLVGFFPYWHPFNHALQRIAERISRNEDNDHAHPPSESLTCPDCGGGMAQVDLPQISHFRCHVGHQFAPQALAAAQADGEPAARADVDGRAVAVSRVPWLVRSWLWTTTRWRSGGAIMMRPRRSSCREVATSTVAAADHVFHRRRIRAA
jgi:hypothetical protein